MKEAEVVCGTRIRRTSLGVDLLGRRGLDAPCGVDFTSSITRKSGVSSHRDSSADDVTGFGLLRQARLAENRDESVARTRTIVPSSPPLATSGIMPAA
jgi:hypothetical protein